LQLVDEQVPHLVIEREQAVIDRETQRLGALRLAHPGQRIGLRGAGDKARKGDDHKEKQPSHYIPQSQSPCQQRSRPPPSQRPRAGLVNMWKVRAPSPFAEVFTLNASARCARSAPSLPPP